MRETCLSDNYGNRAAPGAINCDPVLASGIELAAAGAGTDYTQTVVNATYVITVPIDGGTWFFSLTGLTSTAANREWIAVEGVPIVIHVPPGYTTLYYESDTVDSAYMVKLKM